MIKEKELSFESTIDVDRLIISDAKKLHTIFSNLISNACEYSFRGNKVVLNATVENEALVIRIKNVGDVIAKEYKKEVFSRFKKIGEISKARESVSGLGLGLSIVSALVESLDGDIDYSSSLEGTIFTISLKLQDQAIAEALMSDSANEFMFDDTQEMKEF